MRTPCVLFFALLLITASAVEQHPNVVLIYADESERRAEVLTDGPPPDPSPPLFLRLAVTPGETPAQRLP